MKREQERIDEKKKSANIKQERGRRKLTGVTGRTSPLASRISGKTNVLPMLL